jgi:hypothetical protein
MKFSIFIFAAGLVGGLIGSVAAFRYIGPDFLISSSEFNDQLKSRIVENVPLPTQSQKLNAWQETVNQSSLSSVSVQIFRNNRIISSFTGTVLSSDGIIFVPGFINSVGSVVQVRQGDAIVRASVLKTDALKNASLIKVEDLDLDVTDLSFNEKLSAGQDVLVTGKFIDLSIVAVFSEEGIIRYSSGSQVSIDAEFEDFLSGGKVHDSKGQFIGVAFVKNNNIFLMPASEIKNFFDAHLSG